MVRYGPLEARKQYFSKENLKMETEMISRNKSDKTFDEIKVIEFAIYTKVLLTRAYYY